MLVRPSMISGMREQFLACCSTSRGVRAFSNGDIKVYWVVEGFDMVSEGMLSIGEYEGK